MIIKNCITWKRNYMLHPVSVLFSAAQWSFKKVFRKISQNSQENVCAGVSLIIKVVAPPQPEN